MTKLVSVNIMGKFAPSTFYQLPNTNYQLPTFPICIPLPGNELNDFSEKKKFRISGLMNRFYRFVGSLQSNNSQHRGVLIVRPDPHFYSLLYYLTQYYICGYICTMKDRKRELTKMVHIRFTEDERKQLKAISALEGKSIQEYVRALVIKDIDKKRIK